MPHPPADYWVFAYGSLMWRPDFEHSEGRPALLRGYHRAMCILSTHYRGTREKPGLVLGLKRGGSCRGFAFRVEAGRWEAVRDYLHQRELISDVYHPQFLPVTLDDGRRVSAYSFVANRENPQFAAGLTPEDAARLILQGCGCNGTACDYLGNTVAHLDALGMRGTSLHRQWRLVQKLLERPTAEMGWGAPCER